MGEQYYYKHKRKFDLISGLFLGNTILGSGLVVAPVVVASNTLKNGVLLAITFLVITFFTVLFATYIPQKVPYTIRVVLYMIISSGIYIPTLMYLSYIMPETVYKVGIYLPLLITNSLIATRIESRFRWKKRDVMIVDLFAHIIGFMIVIILVGAIREVLGTGQIWAIPIKDIRIRKTPALMYPFSGFIILGFLSAILQKIKLTIKKPTDIAEGEDN